jgi:chemotaxis receptor (MCP) glutamine deamidase CheD
MAGLLRMWPYCRTVVHTEIQGTCINWCLGTCHLASSCISHIVVTGSRKLKAAISDSAKYYNVCAISFEEKVIYFKSWERGRLVEY